MSTKTKKKKSAAPPPPVQRHHDRDTIIAALEKLGGREEVALFEDIERMERQRSSDTVVYYYQLGQKLAPTWIRHRNGGLRWYAMGLGRNIDLLYAAVRMADLWSQHDVTSIVAKSQRAGHEIHWNHFRQLIKSGLTDEQREQLIEDTTTYRWSSRDLAERVKEIVGKKSKGGRRVTRPKSFRGSVGAMVQRSKAWLDLENGWVEELHDFVKKLPESERYTKKTLNAAREVTAMLQQVKDRANADYLEAQKLVDDINERLDRPQLTQEDDDGPIPGKVKVAPKKKSKVRRRLVAAAH
jgi:hypothetical protein